jgi:hypothetical protein
VNVLPKKKKKINNNINIIYYYLFFFFADFCIYHEFLIFNEKPVYVCVTQ